MRFKTQPNGDCKAVNKAGVEVTIIFCECYDPYDGYSASFMVVEGEYDAEHGCYNAFDTARKAKKFANDNE